MKTITFFAAAAMMLGSAAFANANDLLNAPATHYSLDTPIEFSERGITFFVFPNGEFDYNTVPTATSHVLYRNGHRTDPGYASTGVRIDHDNQGRVRRIGNVFLNYDSRNRIKRIGSVYMTYSRFALTQVGGLKILYNRRGQIVNITGNVKSQYGAYPQSHDPYYADQDNRVLYKNGVRK